MTEKRLSLGVEIPNQNLKAADIPSSTSSWDEIAAFAGSFNAYTNVEAVRCRELASQQRMDFLESEKLALEGSDSASYVRSFFFIGVRYATDTVAVSRRNRKWFTP
jgi:hypothetical protein